jgi:hypothetical protein
MPNGTSQSAVPPPPPPMWMPVAPSSRMNYWPMLAFWGRAIGFILLFVGTLVAVIWVSISSSCYTTTTTCGNLGSGYLSGVANAVVVSKILWAIGLFFLGAAAGIKLHWASPRPQGSAAEDTAAWAADRRMNGLLLTVSIVLLAILLFSVNQWPPILP